MYMLPVTPTAYATPYSNPIPYLTSNLTSDLRSDIGATCEKAKQICSGTHLTSPGGRLLQVHDVFVPKFNSEKSKYLPTQFRNCNRKIVLFKNGAVASLREVQRHYRLFSN